MDGSQTKTDGSTPASRGRIGGVEPATNCATRQRAAPSYFVRGCSAAVAVLARSLGIRSFSHRAKRRRKRASEQSREARHTSGCGASGELRLSGHAVDLHQIRRLSIRLRNISGMFELNSPTPFSFQSFGALPRIANEVVTGERKLEPKSPFLRVQSPAQHEPSHIAPIRPTIAREHSLLPNRFRQHSQ